jgi:hypothetical protein
MIGNQREPDRSQDDLLDGLLGRRRRAKGARDPLGKALDHWLDWLEPPEPPKPWCGSTPPGR